MLPWKSKIDAKIYVHGINKEIFRAPLGNLSPWSSTFINVVSTLIFGWKWKFSRRTFIDVVSTLKFGWKWQLSRRMFTDVVSTLTKQRWNSVDRATLVQCWWPNVVSALILGWKGKLSQRMFIGVEKTALKQLCQYLLYWGSLESGLIITQN